MKKKIVYISGAEVFDVNDVRAAFEEVRNTLRLDTDTILFGVPVDEAESMDVAIDSGIDKVTENTVSPVVETESDDIRPQEVVETKKSKPRGTKKVKDAKPVETDIEPETPVVPILSVLASQEDDNVAQEPPYEDVVEPEPMPESEEIITEETIELDENDSDISDMINDEMPVETKEKTLEELLETMAPLREDVVTPRKNEPAPVEQSIEPVDEIDATLENLASEFAENQDKVGTKKGSERGKIGKLKNILPFKKMKRDDSGLMGDLFGWAGIAANDDDFTIPGFFKQKM